MCERWRSRGETPVSRASHDDRVRTLGVGVWLYATRVELAASVKSNLARWVALLHGAEVR